jgi:hypothetical protein
MGENHFPPNVTDEPHCRRAPGDRSAAKVPAVGVGFDAILSLRTCYEGIHVSRGEDIATNAPFAALHFFENHPSDRSNIFSANGDHDIGEPTDLFLLFRRREHTFDHIYFYEWHGSNTSFLDVS